MGPQVQLDLRVLMAILVNLDLKDSKDSKVRLASLVARDPVDHKDNWDRLEFRVILDCPDHQEQLASKVHLEQRDLLVKQATLVLAALQV